MDMNQLLAVYIGKLAEEEFAPACDWDEATEKAAKDAYEEDDEDKVYRIAMENQPKGWDSTDPPLEYMTVRNLHTFVADELGVDYSELELYTSINTIIDREYGVDAFFVFGTERFTLDYTLNPNKSNGYKADAVLFFQEGTEDELLHYAKDIAKCLRVNSEAPALFTKPETSASAGFSARARAPVSGPRP